MTLLTLHVIQYVHHVEPLTVHSVVNSVESSLSPLLLQYLHAPDVQRENNQRETDAFSIFVMGPKCICHHVICSQRNDSFADMDQTRTGYCISSDITHVHVIRLHGLNVRAAAPVEKMIVNLSSW